MRLPDLPLDDPDMIAAITTVEESAQIQSDAWGLWGGRVVADAQGATPTGVTATETPLMIAYAVHHCVQFVLRAKAGFLLYYHRGHLYADAQINSDVGERGRYCALAAEFGLIKLRQKCIGAGQAEYYALRTDEPLKGVPSMVIEGAITPNEYRALIAVNERQSSIATSRAIRDELGVDDTTA